MKWLVLTELLATVAHVPIDASRQNGAPSRRKQKRDANNKDFTRKVYSQEKYDK